MRGADPGPICYGRGGTEPTVTDANLVLGRIPAHLLGGEVALDVDASRAGVARVAEPLGLSVEEAAAGIIEIAVWNQTHGIRQVSVERGRDPSDFCLLAFGGSGGMVAAEVAELLGIETVLVPERPGNASAFGLQVSDVKRDYVRTLVRSESQADPAEIDAAWAELERRGREDLAAEGVPARPTSRCSAASMLATWARVTRSRSSSTADRWTPPDWLPCAMRSMTCTTARLGTPTGTTRRSRS